MRLLGAALLLVLALEFSPEAKAFKGKNATTIAARSKHKKESVSVPQRKVSPLGSHAEFEPLDEMERKESKMKKKSRERKLHKVEASIKGKHFVHAEKSKHGGLNATFHEDASGESPDVRSEETSTSVKVAAKPNIDAQPTRKQEPEEQSHDSGDEEDGSVDADMSGSGNTPSMSSSSKMILPMPAIPKPSHKAPPPPNPNHMVRPLLPFRPNPKVRLPTKQNFKALSSPKPNFKVPLLPKPNRKVTLSPKPNFKVPPPLKALIKLNPCVSKPVCTSSPCSRPCHPTREAGSIHQIKGAGYEGAYEVLPDGTYISTMTVHPNQLLEETSAQACCPACVGVCSLCMPQCCSQLLGTWLYNYILIHHHHQCTAHLHVNFRARHHLLYDTVHTRHTHCFKPIIIAIPSKLGNL